MKTTTMILVAAFLAAGLAAPVAMAHAPGNNSITFELTNTSYFDFKDGVGIADPHNQNSQCTALLLGLRNAQPTAETWEADQNMGLNINGPGVGVSNLAPPLTPAGGWLPNSGGVNLGIPCPLDGTAPTFAGSNLWLVFSGVNWRSIESDSQTQIALCTAQTFSSSSPGCLSVPGSNLALIASACTSYSAATFSADYTDSKGKYQNGVPFDTLGLKSDKIACSVRHSHDYTNTVQSFGAGAASQTFDLIKNEAVVHNGAGTTYMAVCWSIDYADFTNPLAPVNLVAKTHDWKLIIDSGDAAANIVAAIQNHYAGGQTSTTTPGLAMKGFYSGSSTAAGQNGFGPCPTSATAPEAKKPAPLV